MSYPIQPDEFSTYLRRRLEQEVRAQEARARPSNLMRLPPAALLGPVAFGQPTSRGTNPFESDIRQSQASPAPQMAEDTFIAEDASLHVSDRVRTSLIARLFKTTAVGSLAFVATWTLGLMLSPNEPSEGILSPGRTVTAVAPPQAATMPQRETPQAARNITPAPQPANATHVVANANPAGQAQPQQQLNQQKLQQAQVPERSLGTEEIGRVISLGEKFLAQGDVATARSVLERAAEARDPRAALMLGATYDPEGLKTLGVVGVLPDLKQAHLWYTRAAEFGSHEATQRLAALAQLAR
jgi:hypothetical protein